MAPETGRTVSRVVFAGSVAGAGQNRWSGSIAMNALPEAANTHPTMVGAPMIRLRKLNPQPIVRNQSAPTEIRLAMPEVC